LGKQYATINVHLWQLRKALESQVTKSQGGLSLVNVAKINEALRWEMTARVTQKLIADTPTMPPDKVISALNTIGNATRNRNAIMAKLLDGKTVADAADPWSALDCPDSSATATQAPATGDNGRQVDTLAVQGQDRAAAATAAATAAVPPVPPIPAAADSTLYSLPIPPAEKNGKNDTYQNFPVPENSEAGNSTGVDFLEL